MADLQENNKCYQMHKKTDAPAVIRGALTHHQNRTQQLGGAMVWGYSAMSAVTNLGKAVSTLNFRHLWHNTGGVRPQQRRTELRDGKRWGNADPN